MSTQRKKRAEKREAETAPINFTCGLCRRVHKFNENYECVEDKQEELS